MTMVLVGILSTLALVVGGMVVLAAAWVVGVRQSIEGVRRLRGHLEDSWPYVAALGLVLALNRVARVYGPQFSWVLDLNVTGLIHRIEGTTVATVQSIASPELTAVFGFVYIYGYAFLLVFPVVAYVLLEDRRPLQRTLLAYVLNYAIGVAFYTVFVSYGPRNLLPDLVDPLLYEEYPFTRLLAAQVNDNTNVFPSLHASLATTVAILSWHTRDVYPRWPPLAVPLALGVGFATVYLGIHWIIDVLAGICLGAASVALADRVT